MRVNILLSVHAVHYCRCHHLTWNCC